MAKKWEGKSKGTVLGYKIFVFFIKTLGLSFAYFILNFVVVYYFFFSREGRTSSYDYFKNHLKYSTLKSTISILKNTYVFGQTIIDKVAISSGLRNKFTYEFDGVEEINNLLKEKRGGILISAHVGNFEIADFFFDEIDYNSQIHLVTTDNEHEQIKEYLESVTRKSRIKFILINEDLSHIFEIKTALDQGGLVCFTGDRYFEGNKTLTEKLLGNEAEFPAGPFLMASRLNVPVLFVYVMKEAKKHYHLYARKAKVENRNAQALLKEYTESIEWMLGKYPLQWFNYFKFWNSKKVE